MPAKRDVIVNPFVSEFVYDNIVNSTIEQRRFLNGKYMRIGRNSRAARGFSTKSTAEEKALMLAKLGVPFAWLFNIDEKKLKELFDDQHNFSPVRMTDKLLSEKMFVVTDKQFMQFAGLMASNCHSETYMINRDFLKANYRLKEWKKEYSNTSLSEAKDATPASKDIAKMVSNAIMFSKYTDGEYGINDAEVAVLMFMYSKQKEFIEMDEMRVHFNGIYRNFKLVRCLNTLVKAKYVEKGEGNWDGMYKTTGWGNDIALKFQKRMFALENY